MTTVPHASIRWRKSSFSSAQETCVELELDLHPNTGAVRDSKNPTGPTLAVDLHGFLTAIKNGHFDH